MRTLIASLILSLGSLSLVAQTHEPEQDGPLFLFSMEMEGFIEEALVLQSQATELPRDEIEEKVEALITIAKRMGDLYFRNLDTAHQSEIDKYLGYQLDEYPEIRNYFVLLGNQFVFGAESLVHKQEATHKKYRMYATIGGSILGAATGGAILYFKPNLVQGFWKSSLLVVGLGAAGAGVGYGATYAFPDFILPAEPGIETAEDFLARYPAGEDFINKVDTLDLDLLDGMTEIDEAMDRYEASQDD